ncbi:YitT family protein [Winogradskyella alexanderae]|uniref:YitT family protein n=1 Tax=Winogradskyella alexanderae TaxID=2877123 RepID=A0ABS7XSA2_9FLAO|nr:YitT family protein [Winogradskyella alexanderae]MCA0132897.1 YitT family protein [Winogradskyella alexanderae]
MRHSKTYNLVTEYGQIALGVILASIGLKAFLLPNGFLDGGVTGIALLVRTFVDIRISYLLILFSIPFLILGFYTVSKRIVIKSIVSIVALALFIHFENFDTITDDKLLISIFGGLFLGAGIGIAIRNGSVLDGSEILGVYLNDKFGISIGQIILVFNIVLFSITAWVISTEVALYSILTYIVTAKVTDLTIEGFEDFIGVTIVSKKYELIEEAIMKELGVGITIYKGTRGIGNSGKQVDFDIIHSIINRIDMKKMHRIIDDIDDKAFIIEFDVNNVKGGVLRHYINKKKNKKLPKK